MKNKKKISLSLVLLLPVLLPAVFLVRCNNKRDINPNLTAASLAFELPANAEERFKDLVYGTDLEKVFFRESINYFFSYHNWIGRVKYSGVSHQALFAVDDSKIVYQIENPEQQRLNFSIYNPTGSKLFYRVYLEDKTRKQKIYSEFCKEQQLISRQINLNSSFENGARLVFETKGRGLGAWLNPRFVRKRDNPRIFVIIVLDTLRYDHTSLYGYKRKTTPFIDELALDSRVFNNAYTSTSWTLPAHVSLFSGKDLVQHKVTEPDNYIPEEYPLIAEVFQKNGFVTAAFTGGGFVDDHYGFHRGFQAYSNNPGRVFHLSSAEMVLSHFKNYIETYWGDDLFVFLHTYQAHAPYKCPPKYVRYFNKNLNVNLKGPANFIRDKRTGCFKSIGEENRQILSDLYDSAVFYTDEALVGGVIQYLKDKGVYDRAMIVVTSDHGEEFFDHGSWEHGHSLYNELIKIPLIIKYPGSREKGIENSLVSFTDIAGIILKESGLQYDKNCFAIHVGETERCLPVLFPHSPIIKQIPAKISFVNDKYHFIYNIIDREELKFFDPPPRDLQIFELYEREDTEEKNNLAKKRSKEMRYFRNLLRKYLQLLRDLEGKKGKLDKNLEKELKSLGYLND